MISLEQIQTYIGHTVGRTVGDGSSVYTFLVLAGAAIVALCIPVLLPSAGIGPLTFLFVAVAVFAPLQALALEVFLFPVREFGVVLSSQMHTFHAVAVLTLAARFLASATPKGALALTRLRSPQMLLIFALLVACDNVAPIVSREYWKSVAYAGSLFIITCGLITYSSATERTARLMLGAMLAGAAFSIVFDVAYLYVPIPSLLPADPAIPPDQLRLGGLHANPVATSKFFLVALCFFMCRSAGVGRPLVNRLATCVLVTIFATALIATETKATLLAVGIAGGALAVAVVRAKPSGAGLSGLVACGLLLAGLVLFWPLALGPAVKQHSAAAWLRYLYRLHIDRPDIQQLSERETSSYRVRVAFAATHSFDVPVIEVANRNGNVEPDSWVERAIERVEKNFRIGQSYKLKGSTRNLKDAFEAAFIGSGQERDCGILCTGQRDLLWDAGVQTVRSHWLMGIGFGGWKTEYVNRLGYPFDNPHFGLLNSWGEFGVAGAMLYAWLAWTLCSRAILSFTVARSRGDAWIIPWTSVSALALFMTELANASNFFAVSSLALWAWVLVGLQDRTMRLGDEA
jgi:hypothetical protein